MTCPNRAPRDGLARLCPGFQCSLPPGKHLPVGGPLALSSWSQTLYRAVKDGQKRIMQ